MREEAENLDRLVSVPLNGEVAAWKEGGRKVIGTVCCYVPEEIIVGAGMLPYRVRATGCVRSGRAEAWMSSYSCTFARSCLDLALEGTYDFLDGLVASDSCGQAHRLYDNWRFKAGLPFMHFLSVPRKRGWAALAWYREEMLALKGKLEAFGQAPITHDALERAIGTYNETRSLLRELDGLRCSAEPRVSGQQWQKLVLAAMSMPKDRFNGMLRKYLAKARTGEPLAKARARLMVIGSALDNPRFIGIIEERGGLVVADALCFGSRYLSGPVDTEGDPLSALGRAYLERTGCPRMMDQHEELFLQIKETVEKRGVDGIVFEKMRFCDLWGGAALFYEQKLRESGIPVLALQREHYMTNTSQIAVRVEAFIEMIGGVAA